MLAKHVSSRSALRLAVGIAAQVFALAGATATAGAQGASAAPTTFAFSFDAHELYGPFALSGTGTFSATPTTVGGTPAYLVTGITGTVTGNDDTPGGAITGLVPAGYNDNLLFYTAGGGGQLLDQSGLAFYVGSQSVALYYNSYAGGYGIDSPIGEGVLYAVDDLSVTPAGDAPATTAPEPASLALLGAGLAGVAALGGRRARR